MHNPYRDKWSTSEHPPWGWIIGSCKGDIIASDIPDQELAEYIVKLHNDEVDRKRNEDPSNR